MHVGSAALLNVPAFSVFRDAERGLRAGVSTLAILMVALSAPEPALAQGAAQAQPEAVPSVRPVPAELRRAELKRALTKDDKAYESKTERRRLTAEERSALNQELRAAMRHVYDNVPKERR